MKSAVALLFVSYVALSALHCYNADESASASASSSASSSSNSGDGYAAANANAHSQGGVAYAVAEATSKAFSRSKSITVAKIRTIFRKIPKGRPCKVIHEAIYEDIEVIGLAFAKAIADAYTEVYVEGEGSGCASAEASAKSSAAAFVRIIVDALIIVKRGLNKAIAEAYVEAFLGVYVRAFADAWASACLEGEGLAYASQHSLARALSRPLAAVYVWIEAGIDCTGNEGFAFADGGVFTDIDKRLKASSESDSGVDGKGDADAGGDAGASTGTIDRCKLVHRKCCTLKSGLKCECKIGRTKRCDLHRDGPKSKIWKDNTGKDFCGCAS